MCRIVGELTSAASGRLLHRDDVFRDLTAMIRRWVKGESGLEIGLRILLALWTNARVQR